MQVQRVQNNYNNNFNRKQNISNIQNISFQGIKPQLSAISTDAFNSESTKKLYSKIQKYFQLIGKEGSIKDKKLLQEQTQYFSSKPPFIIKTETDICLSINKREKNSNIQLYRKFSDSQKNNALILDAILDKNGQMTDGHFFAEGDSLYFERDKRNLRRMQGPFGRIYMPLGSNDREWSYFGDKISPSDKAKYVQFGDSVQSAYEIFLELARLKTVIV